MAAITIQCPKCSKTYQVSAEKAGHKAKCSCGQVWIIPVDAPAEASPAAAQPAPAAAKPAASAEGDQAARRSREEEEARKLIGRELGNFRIEDLLGIGGFGAVYRAFDKSLHRDVAVKVLPESMARAGKEKVQRFLQEARAAAKLSHPNIVTVHQICQVEGIYFIVMELVDGKTLADLVRSRMLSPREATRVVTEAVRGLAHAHKRGLIHRDIKPGNIMVTTDGQVKMTDFGLARDIFRDSDETDMGRAVGTPLYMSPEQCEGEEGDSRSDVYAMAATYYVALTRRPPYEGRTTQEVMDHQRYDPPPDPRKAVPTLPPAVFRIIEKAMAKEPDQRYQTATELLGALEGLDFAALDPNAALTLDTVSAQISGVTPEIGSHIGAVMQSAIRRAEHSRSVSTSRSPGGSPSPVRWWILAGVLVALVSVAAIVLAIVMARQHGEDPTPVPRHGAQTESTAPAVTPSAGGGTPTATKVETPAGGQTKPPDNQKTATPEPPVEKPPGALTPEQEREQTAMERLKTAEEYEKSDWTTNPARVVEVYQEIINYFPNTQAAKKAAAAIKRLGDSESQPPPTDAPTTPETPPVAPDKPASDAPTGPAKK